MTTGQRIAAKRKERKLSQEALGEQLGVSRQSIYKWESDTSLPEIDKLVAMSRLFSVSVGWLLGVEEERAEETPAPDSGELTEAQLHMVEEIVARYITAQPKPRKQRKWPLAVVLIVLWCVGINLFYRLDRLDTRYLNLQDSIGNISSNVNSQINTITNRVEEVLKAQNDLTADYGTDYISSDLAANTVTFQLHTVPKTYIPGMEVQFLAEYDNGQLVSVSAAEDANHRFSAQLTCPLTDSITLSAVFITGDTHQTQLLDNYSGLYSGSMPNLDLRGLESSYLHIEANANGQFHLPQAHGWIREISTETKHGTVELESYQVGLFHNYQLLTWLESEPTPESWDIDASQIYKTPELDIQLQMGDILHFAVIFTDVYGRQGAAPSIPYFECFENEISWPNGGDISPLCQIENYKF